jgi:DNA-binding NarL/FixJ family response regulator
MTTVPSEALAPNYRVLIVDDRPEVRVMLRIRLGFEPDLDVVGEASNGAEGVRLTRLLAPSAVVLDLDMPVMDGLEAIPLMRTAAPGMGILLYTATEDPTMAPDAVPDAIVEKGVSLDVLVDRLRTVLEHMPFDVVRIDLGVLPLPQAITAFDTWTGLNVCVLEALHRGAELTDEQLGGATTAELEALMSVYAHIGHNLQKAAGTGSTDVRPVIHIFRETGFLARQALLAFADDNLPAFWKSWGYDVPSLATSALALMRDRLMDVLPASTGSDEPIDVAAA